MESFIFTWPTGSVTLTTSDHITRSAYVPDMADLFSQIVIRADRENEISALLMLPNPPRISIEIPEIGWEGHVESCRFEQSEVQINCVGVHYAGERDLLGGKITRHCRFALFSKECGATKQTVIRNVIRQTNPLLVGLSLPHVPENYSGGFFVVGGETYRLIERTYPENIWVIDRPLWQNLASVTITKGCHHTAMTCINIPNFGGFPTIQDK